MSPGIHVDPQSPLAAWANGLADLWGLSATLPEPVAGAVGFGTAAEARRLADAVAAGRLAGAVVTVAATDELPATLPAHRVVSGRARFDDGTSVEGAYVVFEAGRPVVSSSAGLHAVSSAGLLLVGIDPEPAWGRVDSFWAYEAIAARLEEHGLPVAPRARGIGLLRLDDTPGTAQHQLEGRAKSDRRQRRRIERTVRRLADHGAVLNVAIAAQGLEGGTRVPLEQVWPRSIAAWRHGVERGVVEPVCHGVLHLDTEAFEAGEIEFREFARLDAGEAGERIDAAVAWQTENLGPPTTFAAPAWSYGEAGDREGAQRGLVRWHRPHPGPLLEDGRLHESLYGALPGLHGVDFSPLRRLAAVGVPPMIAMHGALIDSRMQSLRAHPDPLLLARLFVRRDIERLIALRGIRWVSASELVRILEAPEPAG